jgi:hypothetical protein
MNESGAVAERDFLELVEHAVAWPAPPLGYHRRVYGTHCKLTRLTV